MGREGSRARARGHARHAVAPNLVRQQALSHQSWCDRQARRTKTGATCKPVAPKNWCDSGPRAAAQRWARERALPPSLPTPKINRNHSEIENNTPKHHQPPQTSSPPLLDHRSDAGERWSRRRRGLMSPPMMGVGSIWER